MCYETPLISESHYLWTVGRPTSHGTNRQLDHLEKEPKGQEELFIILMHKDTQSMTQI